MIKKYICSSIRNKLLMITGFGTSLVMATTIFGIYSGWEVEQEMSVAMNHTLQIQDEFTNINVGFKTQVQEWKNVLIRGHNEDQRKKYWGKFSKQHEKVQSGVEVMLADVGNAQIEQNLSAFKKEHNRLLPLYKNGLDAFVNSDFDHKAGDKAVKGIDRKLGNMLSKISGLIATNVDETVKSTEQHAVDGIKLTILLLISSVVSAFVIFLVMIKKIIVLPAQAVANDLSLMASGDFTHEIIISSDDELGQLATSAATLREDIGNIVNQINQSVFKLSTSAEEMAHNTEQSNQSMTQQRIETDQVATAMNQMTATVHEVAQNAQLAADSANQANTEVNTGQSVVNESINAISKLVQQVENAADVIHALENDSVEIGSVLDVIRGIAEQTNLLALNAAIEAARAGEQGRGFAVVADEVRTLASRTQQSTEEIQSMIEKLQTGAQQAVESMNQSRSQADVTRDTAARAGEVLTSITTSVTNINDMNTLIASSAEEQNAVAEEINRSIVSISQSAETASQGAAQTAETSEDLRNVAEELKHVISRLHV
ncbi:Methyl-accepting chemotaxis sensor/transducer protein [hydrothermal vent metagenome]|uniref:Methyl-accepting chemotaxis sensor/transducer protein n=1 Tax=hydrothermal vent metagenome TaxID=652676 RepID=A0A3B0X600_9ZZZZ